MISKERLIPIIVLALTSLVIGFDLLTDQSQGAALWHIMIEAAIAFTTLAVAVWLIYQAMQIRNQLKKSKQEAKTNLQEAQKWREMAKSHIEGLSIAISKQLDDWGLSPSEKEIAFLLLKGLSMREIAALRKTNEKTARAQAMMIYQKAGLNGRADLSAYFLEDLLVGI